MTRLFSSLPVLAFVAALWWAAGTIAAGATPSTEAEAEGAVADAVRSGAAGVLLAQDEDEDEDDEDDDDEEEEEGGSGYY